MKALLVLGELIEEFVEPARLEKVFNVLANALGDFLVGVLSSADSCNQRGKSEKSCGAMHRDSLARDKPSLGARWRRPSPVPVPPLVLRGELQDHRTEAKERRNDG